MKNLSDGRFASLFDIPSVNESGELRFINSQGESERRRFCASFEYKNAVFAVVKDSVYNDYYCIRLKWNPFKGLYRSGAAGADAMLISQKLYARHSDFDGAAPHYKVTVDDNGRLLFEKSPGAVITDRKHQIIPPLVGGAVLTLMMLALFLLSKPILTYFIMLTANVSRSAAAAAAFVSIFASALILYALSETKSGLFNYFEIIIVSYTAVALSAFSLYKPLTIILFAAVIAVLFFLRVFPCLYFLVRAKRKKTRQKITRRLCSRLKALIIVFLLLNGVVFMFLLQTDRLEIPDGQIINGTKVEIKVDPKVLSNYEAALQTIRADVWQKASVKERRKAIEAICDYECEAELGFPKAKIKYAELPSEDGYKTYGSYDQFTNTVTVDSEHLANDSVDSVLKTVLHETRHGYQHALIDMYNNVEDNLSEQDKQLSIFRYVQSLRFNLDNYVSSVSDFDEYVSQEAEQDSRAWAEQRLYETYNKYIYFTDASDSSGKSEKK